MSALVSSDLAVQKVTRQQSLLCIDVPTLATVALTHPRSGTVGATESVSRADWLFIDSETITRGAVSMLSGFYILGWPNLQ